MGYYASWYGTVNTNSAPSEEMIKELKRVFEDVYYNENDNSVELSGHMKYYEDEVYDVLEKIKPIVISGEIRFCGEDETHWMIMFHNGNWVEEYGRIYYESQLPTVNEDKEEFLGSIIDIIQDCLDEPQGELICGDWYDDIKNKLENIMKHWKVFM